MPTAEKEQRVRELTEAIARSKSIYLANFTGMNVDLVTKMRRKLRDARVEYVVEKNTLTKRAFAESGVKGLDPYLEGPTGIALGSDEVAGAKILSEFAREFEKPAIKAAYVGGHLYGPDGIKVLAQLPPREVLLGQFIGALRSPLQGFVGVLSGSLRKLVGTIDAIGTKKQG
ncbi:MAG: 50S ribosomal protein L10 [Candidatus Latescibacteria bacterium]|nr:50S ribosomal protein L10 [Candidatus Latescibacterota bacterium]